MNRGKLILGAWLCVASVMAVKSGWDALELREPGFHERSCWFDEEAFRQARCGIFTVRENRQEQFSRTIRLPVVILEAPDKSAPKAPILYVTGGPGGWFLPSALYGFGLWVFAIGGITWIAGLPFFLNFTGITWVALVGHVLYGIAMVAVMQVVKQR